MMTLSDALRYFWPWIGASLFLAAAYRPVFYAWRDSGYRPILWRLMLSTLLLAMLLLSIFAMGVNTVVAVTAMTRAISRSSEIFPAVTISMGIAAIVASVAIAWSILGDPRKQSDDDDLLFPPDHALFK